jgi:outer membrane lipoprotein-sorting protein
MLFALITLFAAQNDAEKLFEKVEARIKKAKTLQAAVTMSAQVNEKKDKRVGKIVIAEQNRARLEFTIEAEKRTIHMISDGEKMSVVTFEDGTKGETRDRKKPEGLTDALKAALTHGGLFLTWPAIVDLGVHDVASTFMVSDLKLGEKEKLAGRETQAITFTLKMSGPGSFSGAIWIDLEKELPVKVELGMKEEDAEVKIVEEYSDWKVDERIDAKQFALEY